MNKGKSILVIMLIWLFNANMVSAKVLGDIDCDGEVGLEEALYALQITTGLKPQLNCIAPDEIVINEIMQDPNAVSDSVGEWFELYNASTSDLDLLGCIISDNGIDSHVISSSLIIAAGSYVVLAKNGDSAQNGNITPDYVYGADFTLANMDDEIIITCCCNVIDEVWYDGGPSFPDPTGASMSLGSPDLDNSIGTNWCIPTIVYGAGDFGTPGGANDICDGSGSVCGDGTVDLSEECDDGNTDNTDACLNTCVSASCGDGYIQSGEEECDDGNLEDGDGCESNCTITKRTVFLTSTTQTGNLGGLSGADTICNDLAATAQLPGTYKAWLSDDTTSPSESFTHHGQFVLVNGTPIANSWSDLIDYAILNPINVDENGNTQSNTDVVWSYTKGDGSRYIYGESCLNWSSESEEEQGTGGYYHLSDFRWSYGGFTTLCSNPQRLYCFEQ